MVRNRGMLKFFTARTWPCLRTRLRRKKEIPDRDIDRAVERKARYEKDPDEHTFEGEVDDENP